MGNNNNNNRKELYKIENFSVVVPQQYLSSDKKQKTSL